MRGSRERGWTILPPVFGIPRQVATAAWPPQLESACSAEPQDIVRSEDVLSAEPPLARHHFRDVDPPLPPLIIAGGSQIL
jgi:hypothetical protein